MFDKIGVWDRDRAVLDDQCGWRKWKGTAVGDDGRGAVVCVETEISGSEKRRLWVSDWERGEFGRLVVSKGLESLSLSVRVSGGGGGSGSIPKKDSGSFSSVCSSPVPWSKYWATEPASEIIVGKLVP